MALPASVQRQLQNGLITMGLSTSVLWQAKVGGSFQAAVAVTVTVKDDVTTQQQDPRPNERYAIRTLTLEVLQAGVAAQLGDQVTYNGVAFILDAMSNLDVPLWICVHKTPIGVQAKGGGLRAAGGGA